MSIIVEKIKLFADEYEAMDFLEKNQELLVWITRQVPFGNDDMWIELHHLTQKEPSTMIELMGSKHDKYLKQLHGSIEKGGSKCKKG